jgi:hypothetical protein
MLSDLDMEPNVAKQRGVCGRLRDLFDFQGGQRSAVLEYSADLATVIQLSTEIGAATRAGTNTGTLESEVSEVSRRNGTISI